MADPETFSIRLGDLPEAISDKIAAETRNYAVPLVADEIPIGSGTLVEIDGHFGILTAEHVARHPFKPELRLDNLGHDGPKLLIPLLDFPADILFPSYALRVFTTERTNDAYGPDLALIVLPRSGVLEEIKARRSFYPLASNIEKKQEEALLDTGFIAFCGFPASQQSNQRAELGYSKVLKLGGFAFLTAPTNFEQTDLWDYFDLGVTRDQVTDIGDSFGGVSGGGVWRVPVYRKKGTPVGTEYYEKMTFAGVAFYEENHLPSGQFFVRTHGPRSIYETFLPTLREQLHH